MRKNLNYFSVLEEFDKRIEKNHQEVQYYADVQEVVVRAKVQLQEMRDMFKRYADLALEEVADDTDYKELERYLKRAHDAIKKSEGYSFRDSRDVARDAEHHRLILDLVARSHDRAQWNRTPDELLEELGLESEGVCYGDV